MRIQQNVLKDMLANIKDPKLRQVYGNIISGKIVAQVRCNSEDIFTEVDVPILDENGDIVYYERGKNKGQAKTERKNILTRKGCKGRVIAFIDENGKVSETEPELSPEGAYGIYSSGLEGSRARLDGQLGFRCYCGNNSILCEEEKGIISPALPSTEDLQKIADRLSRRKINLYKPKNGETNIDGFTVIEVRA